MTSAQPWLGTSKLRWLALGAALAMAVFTQVKECHLARDGFLARLTFGTDFLEHALPEMRALNPPAKWKVGYDGQFYGQLAIDPSLRHPAMEEALDNPPYRARRIMLPAMAWLLGLGNSAWAVQIYCTLNLAAWLALAALAVRWGGLENRSGAYALFPLLAAMGAMQSIELALLDLPAACWVAAALCAARAGKGMLAALCLGVGGLTRETSLIALPILLVVPVVAGSRPWLRRGWWIAIAVLPLVAWCGYVQTRCGAQKMEAGQFDWPLVSMAAFFGERCRHFFATFGKRDLAFILMTISLVTQVAWFLCRKWQWRNPLWLTGTGNAALFLFLGPKIWEDVSLPESRIGLPMTIAFHFGLMNENITPVWWRWLILGNLSLPFAIIR